MTADAVTNTSRTSAFGTRFPATRMVLQRDEDRANVDWLKDAVQRVFAADLEARPSRHVYVSVLPEEIRRRVASIRALPELREAIAAQYPGEIEISAMEETDELYLCHYNEDGGGDHGLFARHYDGNLRFIPFGAVVRALVYLASDGSHEVVFSDSGLAHRFVTYEVGLLDFHRELHWVQGEYVVGAPDRILLKLNFLVVPRGQRTLRSMLFGINLAQFRVVKAAMEYSKSPRTLAQRLVGLVCNAVRLLNNVHPLLPHVAMLATLGAFVGLVVSMFR